MKLFIAFSKTKLLKSILMKSLKYTLLMLASITLFTVLLTAFIALASLTIIVFLAFITCEHLNKRRLEKQVEVKDNETYLVHGYFGIIEQKKLAKIEKTDFSKNLLFINRCHSIKDFSEAAARIDIFQMVYGKNDKYWDLMSEHYAQVIQHVGI